MSAMEAMRAEAFAHLKPYCVQLTREHTRTNIGQLFSALQSINVVFLQDLQEYVIFPLRAILKHPKKCSPDLYLDLFSCMEYVLGHTRVIHWDLFQDIFNTATTMLSCPTDQSKVAKLSEELKIAIIQTLRTLVKSSDQSVIQKLFTVLCLPLLGHAVSLLLNIAEAERARNLRVLAMECLLDLSQADSKYSPCFKADVGSIFASFLPGISVGLCKIITGDTKQGFAVTAKAIYVWMRIVSLVMDDKLLEVYHQKQAKLSTSPNKSVDPRLEGLVVVRDAKWVTSTGSNLAILVKQVLNVRNHSNWRVRLGLVECAEHLLLHCTCSMKDCVPGFLEILVSLIGDDYTKVASSSRRALELFSQSQASEQQRQLTEILEENLHKLATSLPRQIQTADEDDKLWLLNQLNGYLSLLGFKMKSLLLSLPHLRRLSLALVQMLELEWSDVKIVEQRTTIPGHGYDVITTGSHSNIVRPRKYFKLFTNDKIYEKIQGVCHLLGYYGDIHLLVDHFLDIFHESSMFKMQATMVINEMMLGTTGEKVCQSGTKNGRRWHKHSLEDLDTVVRMLVDEYLNPVNFDLPTSLPVRREEGKSMEQQLRSLAITHTSLVQNLTAAQMNRNILQISLYLEGLANFSKVLGQNFSPLLMKVLYPVLERLGDNTAYISNTAYLSLCDIASNCNYNTIDHLIRDNADYLINDISLRLRRLDMNRRCPLVLKVMLQYCSAELLPVITGTISEILGSLDDHYEEDSVLLMGVLNELTKAVVHWFPVTDSAKQHGEEGNKILEKPGTSIETTQNTDLNSEAVAKLKESASKVTQMQGASGISTKDTGLILESKKGTSGGNVDLDSDDSVDDDISKNNSNQNNWRKDEEKCLENTKISKNNSCLKPDNSNDEEREKNQNPSKAKVMDSLCKASAKSDQVRHGSQSNSKRLHLNVPKNHKIEALFNELIGAPNDNFLQDINKSNNDDGKIDENEEDGTKQVVKESGTIAGKVVESGIVGKSQIKPASPDTIAARLKKDFSDLLKVEREGLGEITEEDLANFNPSVEEDTGQFEDAVEGDPDNKPPPPPHVVAVKEVMLRCKHLLGSRNPRLRLLVLETVANVCVSLQPHQNELLPLIHQVWPAFNLCFFDEEKLITIKALEVLHVVTKSSGDFVRHRITKDVLPRLSSFLNSQAEISLHAGSAYQFTVNYKLQIAILKHISSIAKLCCMTGSDLDLLTSSCVQYLSARQPAPLQNTCYECVRELVHLDPDLIWLKLCQLYCPRAYLPPEPSCKLIPALKQTSSSNHYTTNVTLLMLETGLL